jgi:hypothetical protein
VLNRAANFGELRYGDVQHSPAPIGPGAPGGNVHIVGYYVSYVQITVVYIRERLRHWGGPEPRPRLGGCRRIAQAREKPGPYVEGELKGARLGD